MAEEYDLHLDRRTRDKLWSDDLEQFNGCEDSAEIERIIDEEIGRKRKKPKRSKKRKTTK